MVDKISIAIANICGETRKASLYKKLPLDHLRTVKIVYMNLVRQLNRLKNILGL